MNWNTELNLPKNYLVIVFFWVFYNTSIKCILFYLVSSKTGINCKIFEFFSPIVTLYNNIEYTRMTAYNYDSVIHFCLR